MDRLIERHFPGMSDDEADSMIRMMTSFCTLRDKTGDRNTAKLVNIESETSHIVDLDLFEDRVLIRVCFDPVDCRIKTVLPKQ